MESKGKKTTKRNFLKGSARWLMIGACGYFCLGIGQDLQTMISLKSSISKNEKALEEVQEQKEEMLTTRNNLTNPDYIEYLARGKYLVTKENEQIFKFPPINKKSSESQASD
ncbi:MAG: septum formation initiator family protein [Ileibacterium sp.]|nr:septum formation initiator family protein [Ileibacterium sp.]